MIRRHASVAGREATASGLEAPVSTNGRLPLAGREAGGGD